MPRMRKTIAAILAAAAWWLVSCRDVPAPEGGIFSISALLLPSPGLVAGDTLRDSTGLAAPLSVVAFDVAGDTVQNAIMTFVVLDTGAHLAGALLVGDSVGRTVRVVASVAALQTQPAPVKVTLSPDTLVAADSIVHHKTYVLAGGPTDVNSADLTTSVLHLVASQPVGGVEAVIVRYSIDKAPAGDASKGPTLVLMNLNNPSSRDTTDASGKAARTARLRLAALTGTLVSDTAFVSATASYRGRTIGLVQFTLVFTSQ
jgi:hypothetical protein